MGQRPRDLIIEKTAKRKKEILDRGIAITIAKCVFLTMGLGMRLYITVVHGPGVVDLIVAASFMVEEPTVVFSEIWPDCRSVACRNWECGKMTKHARKGLSRQKSCLMALCALSMLFTGTMQAAQISFPEECCVELSISLDYSTGQIVSSSADGVVMAYLTSLEDGTCQILAEIIEDAPAGTSLILAVDNLPSGCGDLVVVDSTGGIGIESTPKAIITQIPPGCQAEVSLRYELFIQDVSKLRAGMGSSEVLFTIVSD